MSLKMIWNKNSMPVQREFSLTYCSVEPETAISFMLRACRSQSHKGKAKRVASTAAGYECIYLKRFPLRTSIVHSGGCLCCHRFAGTRTRMAADRLSSFAVCLDTKCRAGCTPMALMSEERGSPQFGSLSRFMVHMPYWDCNMIRYMAKEGSKYGRQRDREIETQSGMT